MNLPFPGNQSSAVSLSLYGTWPGASYAQRVAQELQSGDAVNIGFGILPTYHAFYWNKVATVTSPGSGTGRDWRSSTAGISVRLCLNAEAFLPSPQQFTYFQGGGLISL